uniref:Uncharacterized protein n=1 Tax=Rhipicephalus pulchellus TaxID=72859 RepID=L7LZ24_RHIPC
MSTFSYHFCSISILLEVSASSRHLLLCPCFFVCYKFHHASPPTSPLLHSFKCSIVDAYPCMFSNLLICEAQY